MVCPGEDDLTVLTNQPGKQLELLLKRQFNRQVDKRTEAYNAIKSRAGCERWQREPAAADVHQLMDPARVGILLPEADDAPPTDPTISRTARPHDAVVLVAPGDGERHTAGHECGRGGRRRHGR